MCDNDDNIDIESNDEQYDEFNPRKPYSMYTLAEKRAHHNELERKRRDHIKNSFASLRESVALLQYDKVASRAQILSKAAEYILNMKHKTFEQNSEIETLERQNKLLQSQIHKLETLLLSKNTPNTVNYENLKEETDSKLLKSESEQMEKRYKTDEIMKQMLEESEEIEDIYEIYEEDETEDEMDEDYE